jgi:putative membrane protein
VPELFRGPLLHAGGVDPTGWLWSDWTVEPTIAIGLLALVGGYLWVTRERPSASALTPLPPLPPKPPSTGGGSLPATSGEGGKRKVAFVAGAVTLFIALGPPLDDWSDHYLLLAHMVQHLLLVLLAAPLLLYGTPAWLLEPLTRNRITNAIGYGLTRPPVAFAIGNAVFVLWHVPMLYEMALRSQPVHVFEHMTMLGGALLVWWPVLGPLPQWPRLALPLHSLYYFAMTLPGSAVGAFITFADPGLYAPYDTARRIFGIDLATDQQAAGLLMWVAVSAIYLLLITVSFFRWASREEAADVEEAARRRTPLVAGATPGDPGARATR